MCRMYYAYHTILIWPEFVRKGTAGLHFYAHCALLIDQSMEGQVTADGALSGPHPTHALGEYNY